jgi:hypothetical protein
MGCETERFLEIVLDRKAKLVYLYRLVTNWLFGN